MATSFDHIYNDTALMKHEILEDTMRDRQTHGATILFREEYTAS